MSRSHQHCILASPDEGDSTFKQKTPKSSHDHSLSRNFKTSMEQILHVVVGIFGCCLTGGGCTDTTQSMHLPPPNTEVDDYEVPLARDSVAIEGRHARSDAIGEEDDMRPASVVRGWSPRSEVGAQVDAEPAATVDCNGRIDEPQSYCRQTEGAASTEMAPLYPEATEDRGSLGGDGRTTCDDSHLGVLKSLRLDFFPDSDDSDALLDYDDAKSWDMCSE